jgi:hypothetical protein
MAEQLSLLVFGGRVEETKHRGIHRPVRSALGGEHEKGNSCENSVMDRILLEKVAGYGPLRSNMFSADSAISGAVLRSITAPSHGRRLIGEVDRNP